MNRLIKHSATALTLALALAPSLALAGLQPTVPPGLGGQALTGSSVVQTINQVVNYIVVVSVVIAIGAFVYGAIRYATGQADKGKEIMKNAAIGLAAMLAVGLIVNTIAGFINRGGNLG